MPSCERAAGVIAWYSAGYSIAPVAMMTDCPAIRRGVEATVPMVPGFVSETVVSWGGGDGGVAGDRAGRRGERGCGSGVRQREGRVVRVGRGERGFARA